MKFRTTASFDAGDVTILREREIEEALRGWAYPTNRRIVDGDLKTRTRTKLVYDVEFEADSVFGFKELFDNIENALIPADVEWGDMPDDPIEFARQAAADFLKHIYRLSRRPKAKQGYRIAASGGRIPDELVERFRVIAGEREEQ